LKRELFASPGQKLLKKKRGTRTRPWDGGSKEREGVWQGKPGPDSAN
jgi:hypothetical protein